MATIKGIVIEIAGDTSGLAKSLKQADTAIKNTSDALKTVNKALDLKPGNVGLIIEKHKLLKNEISETSDRLKVLKETAKAAEEGLKNGTVSREQYAQLRAEIVQTEEKLKDLKKESSIGAELSAGLDGASEKWAAFGSAASAAGTAAATALAGVTAATAAAIGAVASGVTQLVSASVSGYAELEQLEGGMTKLFGDDAATVVNNANSAFITAGMSAAEYMSTATALSASLINSLDGDTAAAAEKVDTAIRAMSDNASVFGTDLSTIQSAFVGFSRGNFSMLDSLSLGYAGTKEGMVELINDSGILEETIENLDDISFDQMVDAIQAVQENMGIAGNTAAEALGTMSGSVDATKSAWKNLVTGLADPNADIGVLVDNMVTSAMAVLDNFQPAVERALEGLTDALPLAVDVIETELPYLIEELLPPLITAATELFDSLFSDVLPTLVTIISDNLDSIIELGLTLIQSLVSGIEENLGPLLDAAVEILMALVEGLVNELPELIPVAIQLLFTLTGKILEMLPTIVEAGVQVLLAVIQGITQQIPELIPTVVDIVITVAETLLENIDDIIIAAVQLAMAIGTGLVQAIPDILARLPEILDALIEGFSGFDDDFISMALNWGADLIDSFVTGIANALPSLIDSVSNVAGTVASYLHFTSPDVGPLAHDLIGRSGKDMIETFANGIKSELGTLESALTVTGDVIADGMTGTTPDYSGTLEGINANLGNMNGTIIIPVYLGGEQIDTLVVDASNRALYKQGGV